MKLAYISNQRLPTEKAYGIQIVSMCQAFAAQGVQVGLIVPTRDRRLGDDIFEYYKVPRSFQVHRVATPDFYFPGIFDRIAFFIKQWISAWLLVRNALSQKPDMIYSRDESVAWLASRFTQRLAFEAHTFSRKRKVVYRRLLKLRIPIVVISASLQREFEVFGFPPERIHLAPDGVDLEKFDIPITQDAAREKVGLPNDRPVVMYTGHLFAWKGAHILAQAAREIPEALVVFVGGMPGDIEHFRNRFRDQGNVRVIGQRPHDEIPLFLKAADVVVLPNTSKEAISKSYTSPLKLFEYMASGIPIVASDLPSIREVLDEHTAFLVTPDDPESLAVGIRKALTDPHASSVVEKARNDVERYTWTERARGILRQFGNI